jgi:hypothetical protein
VSRIFYRASSVLIQIAAAKVSAATPQRGRRHLTML